MKTQGVLLDFFIVIYTKYLLWKPKINENIKTQGVLSFLIRFFFIVRYTKYLYPYECEMKRLSTPTELQQAIDGNKREGRRSGYDTYSMFPGPRPQVPLPPSSLPLPQISPLPPGLRPSTNGFPGFPGSLSKFFFFIFLKVSS